MRVIDQLRRCQRGGPGMIGRGALVSAKALRLRRIMVPPWRLAGDASPRPICAQRVHCIPRSHGTNRYGPSPRTRSLNTKWHHLGTAGRRPLTRKPLATSLQHQPHGLATPSVVCAMCGRTGSGAGRPQPRAHRLLTDVPGRGRITGNGWDGQPRSEYRAGRLRTPLDRLDGGAMAGGQGVVGSNPASPTNFAIQSNDSSWA